MNLETLRDYCLAKPAVTEELPFGPETLVFKVMGKMFVITSLDTEDLRISLKCNPEKAVQLREEYDFVQPGFHLNKTHWNTVYIGGYVKDSLVKEFIDHSYQTVIDGLPKKLREQLRN